MPFCAPASDPRCAGQAEPVYGHCPGCGKWKCIRRRGLCRSCYNKPAVRDATPRKEKNAPKRTGDKLGKERKLPPPTNLQPGTEAKIRLFMHRIWKLKTAANNPADRQFDDRAEEQED